ncbi:MAG: BlaI/MecI/CopY family transcriptional regulator [Acidobacteria bacterium]|nr:BlaI/MecI/CopY family transcriptional regulator [Acidobacteriota bacterium]
MNQLSEKSNKTDPPLEFQLPGRREFQVLGILWAEHPLSVQQVRDRLSAEIPLAYTTVMTILDQLYRKRLVHRNRAGRAYRYRPAHERDFVCRSLVAGFVADFFDSDPQRVRTLLAELDGRPSATVEAPPRPPAAAPHSSPPDPAPSCNADETDPGWGDDDAFLL